MRVNGKSVRQSFKNDLADSMKETLKKGMQQLRNYVEATSEKEEIDALQQQEILAETWFKKASEAREFTSENDETTPLKDADPKKNGCRILEFSREKIKIQMPLLPTVANNYKVNKNRITAGIVKKIVLEYIYENDITMPFFDRASLEFTMYIGPDRKNFPPRDVENLSTKDITDALIGILYENDNIIYIPQITIRGRFTEEPSHTILTIRRVKG